jgi:predicted TIM-barrel fold metal-dependent hydrolase
LSGDTDLLRPDLHGDLFIYPAQRALIMRETGLDCSSLSSWIQAIDLYFEKNIKQCCSIKIALAYLGRLNFTPDVPFRTAERCYADLITGAARHYEDARPLVDYLFHYVVKKAIACQIPLKFHTGLYSGANSLNWSAIRHNLEDLAELAIRYHDCSFIAMHLAYPYQHELILAIRQITNFYADMSWSWIVDPFAASGFLKSALTAAPVSKIMGFGGDYAFPENTYGHLQLTRQFMAGALAELVEAGYFSLQDAVQAAQYVLHDSAQAVYRRQPEPVK